MPYRAYVPAYLYFGKPGSRSMYRGASGPAAVQHVDDDTACHVCGKKDDEEDNEMLLCDNCNRGFHQQCLIPQLEEVPDGEWCAKMRQDRAEICQDRADIRRDCAEMRRDAPRSRGASRCNLGASRCAGSAQAARRPAKRRACTTLIASWRTRGTGGPFSSSCCGNSTTRKTLSPSTASNTPRLTKITGRALAPVPYVVRCDALHLNCNAQEAIRRRGEQPYDGRIPKALGSGWLMPGGGKRQKFIVQSDDEEDDDGNGVPRPPLVVEKMLKSAGVGDDTLDHATVTQFNEARRDLAETCVGMSPRYGPRLHRDMHWLLRLRSGRGVTDMWSCGSLRFCLRSLGLARPHIHYILVYLGHVGHVGHISAPNSILIRVYAFPGARGSGRRRRLRQQPR